MLRALQTLCSDPHRKISYNLKRVTPKRRNCPSDWLKTPSSRSSILPYSQPSAALNTIATFLECVYRKISNLNFLLLLSLAVQKARNMETNTESHCPRNKPDRQRERRQSIFLSSYSQNKRETVFILSFL